MKQETPRKVRLFEAEVTYRAPDGAERGEKFPVRAGGFDEAREMAERYVLEVLKLEEFELRMVGA